MALTKAWLSWLLCLLWLWLLCCRKKRLNGQQPRIRSHVQEDDDDGVG